MKPEVGCGAAIHDDHGRLLLIQRLKAPEAGAWGLPGGKVDFGELAEAAVVREIAEELGIEIVVEKLACLCQMIEADDGRHWIAPVYSARIIAGEPALMEPEKHGGWGWYDLDRLPQELTTPTQQYLVSLKNPDRYALEQTAACDIEEE